MLRQDRATASDRLAAALDPHRPVWSATFAIMALDAFWLAVDRVDVAPIGFTIAAATIMGLMLATAYWSRARPEPVLHAMASATACLVSFTLAIAVLQYPLATLARPFVDREIAALETAVGFDWRAYTGWVAAHPGLARATALAYHSSGPQVGLVVIALSAARRFDRLSRYVSLFALTLGATVALSSLFPAEGPYAVYDGVRQATTGLETVGATWHLEPLRQARAEGLHALALSDMRGLATFPSFHVALALITAWALWPVPVLGLLGALLNVAVIIGAISAGGHYLPDAFAGAALAAVSFALCAGAASAGWPQRPAAALIPPRAEPRSRGRA